MSFEAITTAPNKKLLVMELMNNDYAGVYVTSEIKIDRNLKGFIKDLRFLADELDRQLTDNKE